ncbi:MAG: TIGR04283 family arsenosugar biosynthesis glycosyltransferase [Gammaproteobacteria bacterium]|nr:TIGR04283 family arsenosugar biosynthesis glycosyltransferase [Gammaproteobacteria bacterium]
MSSKPLISVIIPTRNEAECLAATLASLRSLRARGHEVIVVDAGSADATRALARDRCDRLISSAPGRAHQQNAGAQIARGDVFWFLHADTRISRAAEGELLARLRRQPDCWGRFDIRFTSNHPALRIVAACINLRSRLTAIATGDQALFVSRDYFQRLGGFTEQALMEDVELTRRLKRIARPLCLRSPVVTSSRRWETQGIVRTVLLMWCLRAAYFFGVDPQRLARWYA